MYFIDGAYNSIIKYGEELCGDHVEQVLLEDSKIFVLSDGLGSGVKANILATLTSKIASTMLKEGSTLEETIDTISQTLPICKIRKLAYSTFTIIKVYKNGLVYTAEFDNPSIFLLKNGINIDIVKKKRILNKKVIYESNFQLDEDSLLVAVSDGVVHAGVGKSLNLGWEWENVQTYLQELSAQEHSVNGVISKVLGMCQKLYENKAGDDTTVLAVKIRAQETINLLTGPPKNPKNDYEVFKNVLEKEGSIVVCGGTTANIVARILHSEIDVDISTMTPNIPPVAKIKGVKLTTEGVITINQTIQLLKAYMNPSFSSKIDKLLHANNAAAKLATLLIEDCDNLNIWMGQAVNPAHQETGFPMNFNFKENQVKELAKLMDKLGKSVKIYYV